MTMTMLEDMRRFATELDAARTRRKEDWNRIRTDSIDSVRDYSASRKIAAAQSRQDLIAYRQRVLEESNDLREQARELLMSLHQERQRMRETQLAALREENLAFKKSVAKEIRQIGENRVEAAREMMAALSRHRSNMVEEVTEMLAESHRARMELRQHFDDIHGEWIAVASHRAGPSEISRSKPSPSKKASSRDGPITKAGAEPEVEPEAATEKVDLEESILRILKKARKGLDLKTIASKLGIKWRTVTRPTQKLVAKGLVRKKGGLYYPS